MILFLALFIYSSLSLLSSLPPSLSPSLPLAPSLPKLLGELLLDRHNYTVMTRYISNPREPQDDHEHAEGQEQKHTI